MRSREEQVALKVNQYGSLLDRIRVKEERLARVKRELVRMKSRAKTLRAELENLGVGHLFK